MSSLEIAKLTGKPHNDVLKDIRRILEEVEIDAGLFSQVYKAGNGQMQPCFNLPRRECDLIIAGYSAKYRLAIIDRWQELEAAPKIPNSFAEALRLAADTQEALEAAKLQIEQDKPKVDFALAVRRLDGSCSVGEFAKVIGTGQNKLYRQLREDGFLMINNQPYQSVIDRGLFVVIEQTPYTDSNGKTYPSFKTCITGKGQVVLERKYRKAA
ncbi:MAG: phage regulatory protein/antirepressor Ant [Methylococcaceae bacterium]